MQRRIPQLDGVRGIAVLLVIMVHASDKYPSLHLKALFSRGWMGVDLFFVLSGFLITRILLKTKESDGYFKNFYARRCLRIWPLYYSLLLFMFVVTPLLRPSESALIFAPRSSPWWAYPFFLQNFLIPVPTMATGPLGVMWSLAIEEQFYLIWPWVVRYRSSSQLRYISAAILCLSPALRWYLSLHNVNIYPNLFCRLDGLMAGALLALLMQTRSFDPLRWTRWAAVCFALSLPLAVLTDASGARWITFSLTAAAATSLVYLALFSELKLLKAALTSRFLTYTGAISYGLYLLHKIPFDMAQSFHLDRHPALALPLGIVAAYGLATVSWRVLEKPFLNLKRFFAPEPNLAERHQVFRSEETPVHG